MFRLSNALALALDAHCPMGGSSGGGSTSGRDPSGGSGGSGSTFG